MRKSSSGLFLMELIIVIFFFALTSAVCIQIFVRAHFAMEESRDLNYANSWATNIGELFYEYSADADSIEKYLPSDENYEIDLKFREDDKYDYLDFACFKSGDHKLIYDYTFKKYKQEVLD